MIDQFIKKEENLKIAINKVNGWLEWMQRNKDILSYETLAKWNNLHDLSDRLQDRINDNYKAYKAWHWDKHGFNTYP